MTQFTVGQIREAVLRTAQLIEDEPECYDFYETQVPPKGLKFGCRGCLLGIIGMELGMPHTTTTLDGVAQAMGLSDPSRFYRDMSRLEPDVDWTLTEFAPGVLREYAKLNLQEKPDAQPSA